MGDIAIGVENLSKHYKIAASKYRHDTLREQLVHSLATVLRRNGRRPHLSTQTFWALKDVSFEVKQAEVMGIIGSNGAGKSTLLKILSRITEPTSGRAKIYGRVASLLEVGTGFDHELTGRENIYLSGSILGMKKAEIDRKFDEIVAFAEVEKFLDTPVKRYSSGMYVRLAFAVAAHLEPEVLLVDEVLAVGDIAFQKKCLGKLGEVTKEGRTVLFVSHQMNQIRRLCERCIWLDAGGIRMDGAAAEVVSAYETALTSKRLDAIQDRDDTQVAARFLKWEIAEPSDQEPHSLTTLGSVSIRLLLKVNKPIKACHHGINLWGQEGQVLWGWAANNLSFDEGLYELVYKLPSLPLKPGVYAVHTSLYDENGLVDVWYWVPELTVATTPQTHPVDFWAGILNIPCEFNPRKIHGLR